jgi:hypothetical protein
MNFLQYRHEWLRIIVRSRRLSGDVMQLVCVSTSARRRKMYMMRSIFRAQRGKAPEIIDVFKAVNQAYMAQAGFSKGKSTPI